MHSFKFAVLVASWLLLKAAFHYSSQLQTSFSTRFAARFSTSSCGFATRFRPAFDFFCRKPGRELQQVRWFVRVLVKWTVEKNPFKASSQLAFDMLSTCLRPGFWPGLQLARIMECSLYCTSNCASWTTQNKKGVDEQARKCTTSSDMLILHSWRLWRVVVAGLFLMWASRLSCKQWDQVFQRLTWYFLREAVQNSRQSRLQNIHFM